MYWVIHYRNGVAMTDARNREAAEKWCNTHLGISQGPFAITPAIQSDFDTVCLDTICDGSEALAHDADVVMIDRESRRYPALKLATRH